MRTHGLGGRRVIGLVALVVLLVAMALNTRFVTPEELASIGPQEFDPVATAKSLFADAGEQYAGDAPPLADVVQGVQSDPAKAAEEFSAAKPNSTTYVFPVSGTGTVTQVDPTALQLKVEGVPAETTVLIPLGTAINGTVLRDALGFKFADAPGQSDYQRVGDELKTLMQAAVTQGTGDPASLKGKTVTFAGAVSVTADGSPQPAAKPVSVQPVSVEAGS